MLGRIEEAFDERTASEARLRRFVADASHELRTPVATIRGYAELYRTARSSEHRDLDDAMRRTEQEAIRMGTLVDDLLHLARLDQGRPLERRPVDLGPLVEDAVRDAQAVDPDRAIARGDRRPVEVLGDGARLHQVVANLVANALVHAPGAPSRCASASRGGCRGGRGRRRRARAWPRPTPPARSSASTGPMPRGAATTAAAASACRSSTRPCGPTAGSAVIDERAGRGHDRADRAAARSRSRCDGQLLDAVRDAVGLRGSARGAPSTGA